MTPWEAFWLGLTEGITEFLPISSTGHLIIAESMLGLAPSEGLSAYLIVIQLGAILAVWALYPKRFAQLFKGVADLSKGKTKTAEAGLLVKLLIAFVPAATVGLLLGEYIERYLFSVLAVVLALAAGALVMIAADLAPKTKSTAKNIEDLSFGGALKIGLWQILSLWPGMSRSMTTIVGGIKAGLSRPAAAEFSFLLGAVILGAAGLYKGIKSHEAIAQLGALPILIGLVAAFVSALVVVRFFVGALNRWGLIPWAIYRLVLVGFLTLL